MNKPKDAPTLQGVIKHELTKSKTPVLATLTRRCVLDACIADPYLPRIRDSLEATRGLQYAIRRHYFEAIRYNPVKARAYTYAFNCPPSSFHVTPYTKLCKNPKVCPWCYSRRLWKVFKALTEPPLKIRKSHRLVLWQRSFALTDKLPFFKADSGPHQWFKAAVTVQLVMPIFNTHLQSIYLSHIGLQVVPRTTTGVATRLNERCNGMPLTVREFKSCSQDVIYKVLSVVTRVPWMDLYTPENLPFFVDLLGMLPRQRLLRISRYKPKGDLYGD